MLRLTKGGLHHTEAVLHRTKSKPTLEVLLEDVLRLTDTILHHTEARLVLDELAEVVLCHVRVALHHTGAKHGLEELPEALLELQPDIMEANPSSRDEHPTVELSSLGDNIPRHTKAVPPIAVGYELPKAVLYRTEAKPALDELTRSSLSDLDLPGLARGRWGSTACLSLFTISKPGLEELPEDVLCLTKAVLHHNEAALQPPPCLKSYKAMLLLLLLLPPSLPFPSSTSPPSHLPATSKDSWGREQHTLAMVRTFRSCWPMG